MRGALEEGRSPGRQGIRDHNCSSCCAYGDVEVTWKVPFIVQNTAFSTSGYSGGTLPMG